MFNINYINKPISNFEFIQRKGVGNRNSLCDGIAEYLTWTYQDIYMRDYGKPQPCEFDVRIIGGKTKPVYGGGNIDKPSTILVYGSAAPCSQDNDDIVIDGVIEFLNNVTPRFDINTIVSGIKEGPKAPKPEKLNFFKRSSFPEYGSGYANDSILENIIFGIEDDFIPLAHTNHINPVGYDINTTGIRVKNNVKILVNCTMIDEYLTDEYEYEAIVQSMKEYLTDDIQETLDVNDLPYNFEIQINDKCEFLTTMGTFAEKYDGICRNGNGCNGLINPIYPMQFISGKDSQYSAEKIYSVLSTQISNRIIDETDISEIEIFMLSEYGKPILEPKLINVNINNDAVIHKNAITEIVDNTMLIDTNQYSTY